MSSRILQRLPKPPPAFTEEEKEIWSEYATNLHGKGLLTTDSVEGLEKLVYWELSKRDVLTNLNEDFTTQQAVLLKGRKVKLHSTMLLLNYKAVQDEINEIRLDLGLEPESPQYISNTPLIPDDVYENLPDALNGTCRYIDNFRKKDTFLIYALSVLSFHLMNVQFEHAEGVFGANIKTLVLNPEGTVSIFARRSADLAAVLNEEIKKGHTTLGHPIVTSASDIHAINKVLLSNNGKALLFDRMITQPGSYKDADADLFRELIKNSVVRELVAVTDGHHNQRTVTPCISMSQCATISSLKDIVELYGQDHLNNFLIYVHDEPAVWDSVRPTAASKGFSQNIQELSTRMYNLFKDIEKENKTIRVALEDSHWQMIDSTFEQKIEIIKELGLMQQLSGMLHNSSVYVVKIAILFRMMRLAEEGGMLRNEESIKTKDEDLVASLWLVDTLMKHSMRIYQNIPVMRKSNKGDRYSRLYDLLPIVFDTSRALEIAKRIAIPKRTANRYLLNYLESNFLGRLRKGVYHKKEF